MSRLLALRSVRRQPTAGVFRKQIAKLKKGVEAWNAWRKTSPYALADLHHADLVGADLRNVDFEAADLRGTRLVRADLRHANLARADLRDADLRGASLRGAYRANGSYLGGADLRSANLEGANLEGADLFDVNLRAANLSRAYLSDAKIMKADLRDAVLIGAHIGNVRLPASIVEAKDLSFSLIDWRTVARSIQLHGLQSVLERSGMPAIMAAYLIDSAKSIDASDLFTMMQSVFLSYEGSDRGFAERLRSALQDNGIKRWFLPEETIPGEGVNALLRTSIRSYDRMILICSRASLLEPGVLNEVAEVLECEQAEGATILIPILLDDAIFERGHAPPQWWPDDQRAVHRTVCERVAADFREVLDDPNRWNEEVAKLVQALRKRPDMAAKQP